MLGFFPAHPVHDCEYLISRAKAEAEMADCATSFRAAEVHHELASLYLARVFSDEASEPEDPWERLAAWREKGLALRSIFNPHSGSLNPQLPAQETAQFVELLGKLDSRRSD